MSKRTDDWQHELDEILSVCEERGRRPVELPHCAICVRFSTDNLPFEALMSLLEVLPDELLPAALNAARRRLEGVRPDMCQQQVSHVTLPVIMDSPGWLLVRSLSIDMADQDILRFFDDQRFSNIAELTLLGFAYGGCEVRAEFADALFQSKQFPRLRTLLLHSIENT